MEMRLVFVSAWSTMERNMTTGRTERMNVSSERLFKRIIIAILCMLCAVLILLCVILGVQNQRCRERLDESAADPALADSSAQPLPPEVPGWQALYRNSMPTIRALHGEYGQGGLPHL